MDSSLKMDIDAAKADQWIGEVHAQIIIAEDILRDIARDSRSEAGETDTIMQGISAVAESADAVWHGVIDAFDVVTNSLKGTLAALQKAVANAQETISEAAKAFNR